MNGSWQAGEISDKRRILAFLETDRLYAAYALGEREPELFADCMWTTAQFNGETRALGLHFRGRGFGSDVTTAVLNELFRLGIRDIVLNVRQDNAPALHLYEQLGFERHCAFWEGPASVREAAIAREAADVCL